MAPAPTGMRSGSADRSTPSRFYEREVQRYDTPGNRIFYQTIAAGLLETITDPERIGTILEIGAGTGFATKVLRQRYPRARIVALEPSQSMTERGRCRVPDALWRSEPVYAADPGRFNLVFSSMSYHWLSEHERQVIAKSACGGRLAIAVSVVDRPGAADDLGGVPDGNERLKQVVYKVREKTPWSRSDRRTDRLVEAVGRNFHKVTYDHLSINETFGDAREFADTLFSRGSLLALFSTHAPEAYKELLSINDATGPISFRWKIALITATRT